MGADAAPLTASAAWQHLAALPRPALKNLFASNPVRAATLHLQAAGINFNYALHHVTPEILNALLALTDQQQMPSQIQALFAGDKVNVTEGRAATHWQHRAPNRPAEILAVEAQSAAITKQIRSLAWLGATGKPIKHIVNIGIGGSDIGVRLLADALRPTTTPVQIHFIANLDPAEFAQVTANLQAAETLFVIVSKSFTTLETKINADRAKAWLQQNLGAGAELSRHLLAVTTNLAAAAIMGIQAQHCFGFADSVGGRFSLWGPVNLAAEIYLGTEVIQQFRAGAAAMDAHFTSAAPAQNLPLISALLNIWQQNFGGGTARAILPYSHQLNLLPAYLQQVMMESNGKSITTTGQPVTHQTAPVIFGAAGTLGQHSFYQLLHQGTQHITSDIIMLADADDWLLANAIGQATALALGHDSTNPHQLHAGNKPVSLITLPQLTPRSLGALLAFYEHQVFCEAAIWHINPFDQYGVELGKKLATACHAALTGSASAPNPLSAALIAQIQALRGGAG